MLRIIKYMYNKVKTCVRGYNSYSDFFECAVGLKQGGGGGYGGWGGVWGGGG